MSEFKSDIHVITIEPHPNADRIEIAKVGEYNCIVAKDAFKTGDLAAYIPEGAIVPEDVLEELGLTGRLSGSNKNRVKAIKLRGVLSQGIVHPVKTGRLEMIVCKEGDDVTEILGLEKYVPKVPTALSGHTNKPVFNNPATLKYDVNAWKRQRLYTKDLFKGVEVVATEKIHGTFCGISYRPEDGFAVFSKGLGGRGITLKDCPENDNNVYVQALRKYKGKIEDFHRMSLHSDSRVFICGEIFGEGVQDLSYGVPRDQKAFAVFDIRVNDRWLPWDEVEDLCEMVGLTTVPVLYVGFDLDVALSYVDGKTTYPGKHTREGIVLRTFEETVDKMGQRCVLKLVSEAYLLREKGTEYE